MNLKLFFITIFISLFFLNSTHFIYAQREVEDYNYQYEKYREAYKDFEVARSDFVKHQTLTSQNELIEQLRRVLIQRAQVMRTYFLALKYKLNTTAGVANSEKAELGASLDDHIGWLQNNMDTIEDLPSPTLSDLFEYSKRLEKQDADYLILGYTSLATILSGKMRNLHQQLLNVNSNLKSYVDSSNIKFLTNWWKEADDSILKARNKLTNAETLINEELAGNTSNENKVVTILSEIQVILKDSQTDLLNGSKYQKEIINEMGKSLNLELNPKQEAKQGSDSAQIKDKTADASISGEIKNE
ncbi:hypothetical protein GYA19_02800 [Candidatus Beckwithbacteria bacterium]|nr:hypothetical protein [Candidatus Beckwithbacteria bacterium]